MMIPGNPNEQPDVAPVAPVVATPVLQAPAHIVVPPVVVVPVEIFTSNKVASLAEIADSLKEITMADIVTGTVTGQLDTSDLIRMGGDIRREQEAIGSTIRRETAKEASDLQDSVKTAGWANSDRTGTEADRVVAQDTAYFIAGQQYNFSNATALAALKASTDAQFAATQAAIALAASTTSAAATLAGERAAAASALGQALIGQQIVADGNATRALANQLKMDEMNRQLSERHASLVEARGDSRYWQHGVSQGQFAAVTSQLAAFQSQLQEARQGVTNFGTMSGNAGRQNATNNVA